MLKGYQHVPPASTRKKASMSASVPTSPSPLKSAVEAHGAEGHVPARQAKKLSISASVPTSPSQSKTAEPQQLSTQRAQYAETPAPAFTKAPPTYSVPPALARDAAYGYGPAVRPSPIALQLDPSQRAMFA